MVMLNAAMKQMNYVPVHTPVAAATTSAATAASAKGAPEEESFFQHMLDVVNPLQHLPVVGTIYRAITGEKLDAVEKIAGDALYGGLWGAVTAVADVAFEGITGKSVEDTVLAWFQDDAAPTALAAAKEAPGIATSKAMVAANVPMLEANAAAFNTALMAKGVNADLAGRAMYAYRRSTALTQPVPSPVLASIN